MLKVTEAAAARIRAVVAENAGKYRGLRVGLQDGGCSGYSWLLEFENGDPDDLVIEEGGAKVFVHPLHAPFLSDSVLQWQEDRFQTGFQVENPNIKRTCGCGVSFDL